MRAALIVGVLLAALPAKAIDATWVPDTEPTTSTGENGGSVRGYRRPPPAAARSGDVDEGVASQTTSDKGPTVDDARGTFETLVDTWVQANRSEDGTIHLTDPKTRRVMALSFVKADPTTVRPLEAGLFAGDVILRARNGAKVVALATEDLHGSEWAILGLDLPGRKRPATARKGGAAAASTALGRAFSSAVVEYVKAAVKREGAFFLDAGGSKRRRLKLKMITGSGIKMDDDTHGHAVVYFNDLDDQSSVPVEFYVSFSGDSAQVYRTAPHEGE